ncbi:hypothetical protein ES705_06827 [subsurface metagenome]
MALTKCSECGREVSDKATACPGCGAPIATVSVGVPTQTIEQTSKRLKAQYAIAGIIFFVGLVWLIFGAIYAANTNQAVSPIPIILVAVASIWGIATKIRIWWHHK